MVDATDSRQFSERSRVASFEPTPRMPVARHPLSVHCSVDWFRLPLLPATLSRREQITRPTSSLFCRCSPIPQKSAAATQTDGSNTTFALHQKTFF